MSNVKPLIEFATPLQGKIVVHEHRFGDAATGPEVVIVAGLHGDEVAGVVAASMLARRLAEQPAGSIRGLVRIVPVVNVEGFNAGQRTWPADELDLNRAFPGFSLGDPVQRMVAQFFEAVNKARYGVDIHGSNAIFEEEPHVRLTEPGAEQMALAPAFGLPFVYTTDAKAVMRATLVYNWQIWGVRSFTILGGVARSGTLGASEKIFRALLRFLKTLRIVDAGAEFAEPSFLFPHTHQALILNKEPGLFVPHARMGTFCKAGEHLGDVTSVLTGKVVEEIRAPQTGLIAGIRRYPVLASRELVVRLLTDHPIGDGSGIYFQQ